MSIQISRRDYLRTLTAIGAASIARTSSGESPSTGWRLATFHADVTPRLGHPLLGGQFAPARSIGDPLLAKGIVLHGGGEPIVLVAVDWCELRNDAYARWLDVLAKAAETTRDRVLVSCVHQHDAPYFDLTAQRLLAASPRGGLMCDVDYHERSVQSVAAALKASLARSRPVTHFGYGQARVEQIASNRRVVAADGQVSFRRYSRTADPAVRALPEGTIDPWLKTIAFFDGGQPLAAINSYACHPMSNYGQGEVSADFVGLARERRERDDPSVFQMYLTGCSGDVTAGKYNDGAAEVRGQLTSRLHDALVAAWKTIKPQPVGRIECRAVDVLLPHSELPSLSETKLREQLNGEGSLYTRASAAMGLSSLAANPNGHAIALKMIDFGPAQLVLLPAESFVDYQLYAQGLKPGGFVMGVGFGECSAGYLPTDAAFHEGFREEHGYCWVRPGAEAILKAGLDKLLAPNGSAGK